MRGDTTGLRARTTYKNTQSRTAETWRVEQICSMLSYTIEASNRPYP